MLPTIDAAFHRAPLWPDAVIGIVLGLVLAAVIIAWVRMR